MLKTYTLGTHRAASPEQTLERIQPSLRDFGVTRCANVTGLDRLGIPVFMSVRPQGRILQVSAGKGLRPIDAKVSALMESIECWHAENPVTGVHRSSLAALRRDGGQPIDPRQVQGFWPMVAFDDGHRLDWVRGEDLRSGENVWLPAFAGRYCRHQPHSFSFNGLASGNNVLEATLHAMCEVLERDVLSRLFRDGTVRLERCDVIELKTVTDAGVGWLWEAALRADVKTVLLRAPTDLPIHVFWATLLDPHPFSTVSTVNVGYGAHLDPGVAAVRAITEAAQSRLTFIHGAREDLDRGTYRSADIPHPVAAVFESLCPDTSWRSLENFASDDLDRDLTRLLAAVDEPVYQRVLRIDLSQSIAEVAVVKVAILGTKLAAGL